MRNDTPIRGAEDYSYKSRAQGYPGAMGYPTDGHRVKHMGPRH